jgi:hypothetical protein
MRGPMTVSESRAALRPEGREATVARWLISSAVIGALVMIAGFTLMGAGKRASDAIRAASLQKQGMIVAGLGLALGLGGAAATSCHHARTGRGR